MQEEIDKFVPEETIEGSIVAIEWFKRYLYPVTPYSMLKLTQDADIKDIKTNYLLRFVEANDHVINDQIEDDEAKAYCLKLSLAGLVLTNNSAKEYYDQNWESIKNAGSYDNFVKRCAGNKIAGSPRKTAFKMDIESAQSYWALLDGVDSKLRAKFIAEHVSLIEQKIAKCFNFEEYIHTHPDFHRGFIGTRFRGVLVVSSVNISGFVWVTQKGLIPYKMYNMLILSAIGGGNELLPEFFCIVIISALYMKLYYDYKRHPATPPLRLLPQYRYYSLFIEFLMFSITLGLCNKRGMNKGVLFVVAWMNYFCISILVYLNYQIEKDGNGWAVITHINKLKSEGRLVPDYFYDSFFYFDELTNGIRNRWAVSCASWPAMIVITHGLGKDLYDYIYNREEVRENCTCFVNLMKLIHDVGSQLQIVATRIFGEKLKETITGDLVQNYNVKVMLDQFSQLHVGAQVQNVLLDGNLCYQYLVRLFGHHYGRTAVFCSEWMKYGAIRSQEVGAVIHAQSQLLYTHCHAVLARLLEFVLPHIQSMNTAPVGMRLIGPMRSIMGLKVDTEEDGSNVIPPLDRGVSDLKPIKSMDSETTDMTIGVLTPKRSFLGFSTKKEYYAGKTKLKEVRSTSFSSYLLHAKLPLDFGNGTVNVLIKLHRPKVGDIANEKRIYALLQNKYPDNQTGCVKFYDGNKEFIVIEAVSGKTLDQFSLSPYPVRKTIAYEILNAINRIHGAGVVHGDIKPQNILVRVDEYGVTTVKLCDLDSARIVKEPFPVIDGQMKCTRAFVSPEVYHGTTGLTAQFAIDIFALGLIFRHLLDPKGNPQMEGLPEENMDRLLTNQETLNQFLSLQDPGKDAILQKMCCLNPKERSHIGEIKAQVNQLLNATQALNRAKYAEEGVAAKLGHIHSDVQNMSEKVNRIHMQLEKFSADITSELKQNNYLASNGTFLTDMISLSENCQNRLFGANQLSDPKSGVDVAKKEIKKLYVGMQKEWDKVNQNQEYDSILAKLSNNMDTVMRMIQLNTEDNKENKRMMEELCTNTSQLHAELLDIKTICQETLQKCMIIGSDVRNILDSDKKLEYKLQLMNDAIISNQLSVQAQMKEYCTEILENEKQLKTANVRDREELTTSLKGLKNSVNELLKGVHEVPIHAVLLIKPQADKSYYQRLDFIHDIYYVRLICSHTYDFVICGEDGKGYELKMNKSWFNQISPWMITLLTVVKIGLACSGFPLPIPIPGDYGSLPGDEIIGAALDAFELNKVSEASMDMSSKSSRDAYEVMKAIFKEVDPQLQYTGLVKEVCMSSGKVGWVRNNPEVIESFHKHKGERMPSSNNAINSVKSKSSPVKSNNIRIAESTR